MQVLDSSMAHYLSSQGSPEQKNELDGSRQNIARYKITYLLNLMHILSFNHLYTHLLTNLLNLSSIGTVDGLNTLRKLNLSFNPLNSLKNIDQFPNLRVLDVYACALTNVEDLRTNNKLGNCALICLYHTHSLTVTYPHLEIVHLQQNKIKKIPFGFSNCIKLKELRFDHNNIAIIDNLNRCTGLVSLNLSWNNITSLDGISGLQSLTELKIRYSLLTHLLTYSLTHLLTHLLTHTVIIKSAV